MTEPPRDRGRPGITISRRHRGLNPAHSSLRSQPGRHPPTWGLGTAAKRPAGAGSIPRSAGSGHSRRALKRHNLRHHTDHRHGTPWQTCWYSTNLPRHVAQPADTNRKTTRLRNTRDIEIWRQDPRRLRRRSATWEQNRMGSRHLPRSEAPQPEAPHRPIATAPPWQTCQHPTNLPHHMAQPGNTNRKTTHQCST